MSDPLGALSSLVPGTFVPDLGASTFDETPKTAAIPGIGAAGPAEGGGSFKETLKGLLEDVNGKVQASDQNTRDLADGKTNDLQKVVTSVEEANLALEFTMSMRSKLLEAYQEISRIQV